MSGLDLLFLFCIDCKLDNESDRIADLGGLLQNIQLNAFLIATNYDVYIETLSLSLTVLVTFTFGMTKADATFPFGSFDPSV